MAQTPATTSGTMFDREFECDGIMDDAKNILHEEECLSFYDQVLLPSTLLNFEEFGILCKLTPSIAFVCVFRIIESVVTSCC